MTRSCIETGEEKQGPHLRFEGKCSLSLRGLRDDNLVGRYAPNRNVFVFTDDASERLGSSSREGMVSVPGEVRFPNP